MTETESIISGKEWDSLYHLRQALGKKGYELTLIRKGTYQGDFLWACLQCHRTGSMSYADEKDAKKAGRKHRHHDEVIVVKEVFV